MHATKKKPTLKYKPRIKSKNKSYPIKDSALYNLTTKKRLENILKKPTSELISLANDANYRVFFHKRLDGKKREIQAPTIGLDIIQTRIASLLVRIAIPDYVHSGVKGKSNISNAKIHAGDHPVLTIDIKNFYPSISRKSIFHFFKNTMNDAPDVADMLAGLCTYQDHIPTGSRISMLLSFWANHKMYSSLHALCESQEVTMSIYVDDMTFSGRSVNRLFQRKVEKIVSNAGLEVHPEKTRLYKRYQPKLVTGVIIDGETFKVRNKHHKNIYTLVNEIKSAKSDASLKSLQKSLFGSLHAAGQIDPIFKQRAKAFLAHKNQT